MQSVSSEMRSPYAYDSSVMAKSAGTSFRTDIEGLRGLAIALVVVFHVFVGKVSAGVDVFLLLGGIFFFSSQLNNARRKDGLTIVQSLLRIVRRLFPLLAVVVAATLAGSLFVMSKLVHVTMAQDAVGALGYYINWVLAFSGREYTNVRNTVSPFQHLWSMSAQLQIYVASLLVVVLIAAIFRRFAKGALLVVLTAGTVASFAYACWLNVDTQALNYYSTFSRFWEVGLGGLLGLWLLRRRKDGSLAIPPIPSVWRWIMGLAGLAAIICTGLFLNGSEQFPGPWTLVPLVGAALVVISGTGGRPTGVTRMLESRVFQFLGRISYALYLWHWPLLVLVVAWMEQRSSAKPADSPAGGGTMVDPLVGTGVIAVSLALAWLSSRLIEKPLRQGKKPARSWVLWNPKYWWNSIKVWPKTIYTLVILFIAGAIIASPTYLQEQAEANTEDLMAHAMDRSTYPGAESFLYDRYTPEGLPLIPPLEDFKALLPPTQPDGCQIGFEPAVVITHKNYNQSAEECAYGDVNSDRTLYVIGGSHSEHYMPAMDLVGKQRGLKIMPLLKMGCPVGSTVPLWTGEDYPSCREWSDAVMDYIMENPPTDGIFMTGTRPNDYLGQGPEVVPDEYVDVVRKFTDAGIHSYLVRDNPWHMQRNPEEGQFNQRECVSEMMEGNFAGNGDPNYDGTEFPGVADQNAPTPEEIETINSVCGSAVEESLLPVSPQYEAYQGLDVTHVDPTLGYCKDGWCPSIIGNMAVYRDAHHFTNVFAASLAPEIERQMFADPPLGPLPPLKPFVAFPPADGAVPPAGEEEVPPADEDGNSRAIGSLDKDEFASLEGQGSDSDVDANTDGTGANGTGQGVSPAPGTGGGTGTGTGVQQYDPQTGYPIEPSTGLPYDPNTGAVVTPGYQSPYPPYGGGYDDGYGY